MDILYSKSTLFALLRDSLYVSESNDDYGELETTFDDLLLDHGFSKNMARAFILPGGFKSIRYTKYNIVQYVDLIEYFGYEHISKKFGKFIVRKYIFRKHKYLDLTIRFPLIQDTLIDWFAKGYRKDDAFAKYVSCHFAIKKIKANGKYLQEAHKLLSDDGIMCFVDDLEVLDIYGNANISDISVSQLTHLNSFRMGVFNTSHAYKHLTNLVELDIDGDNNNVLVGSLANLVKLEVLRISYSSIFDDSSIAHLINLRILNIRSCYNITDGGICNLIHLEELYANGKITNNGIRNLSALRVLDLSCNNLITDNGLLHLTHLSSLNISTNSVISGVCFIHLQSLSKLYANYAPISIDQIKRIAGQLTCFHAFSNNFDSQGIDVLKLMVNLEEISLSTFVGLQRCDLIKICPKLKNIILM